MVGRWRGGHGDDGHGHHKLALFCCRCESCTGISGCCRGACSIGYASSCATRRARRGGCNHGSAALGRVLADGDSCSGSPHWIERTRAAQCPEALGADDGGRGLRVSCSAPQLEVQRRDSQHGQHADVDRRHEPGDCPFRRRHLRGLPAQYGRVVQVVLQQHRRDNGSGCRGAQAAALADVEPE